MADREKRVTGEVAVMDLERCFRDAVRAWEQGRHRPHGRTADYRENLEDRLIFLMQSVARLARTEGLDEARIATECVSAFSSGTGITSDDTDDDAPSVAVQVDGMQTVRFLDDLLDSTDTIWVPDVVIDADALPYDILVRGDDAGGVTDEWTFGAEWNGNVARRVSYCHVASDEGDGAAKTTVLFNDTFDENAVDIEASDGRTHVVLVQGLVPTSFRDVWKGIGYQWGRYGRGTRDRMTDVTFPTLSVNGRVGDGDEMPLIEVSIDGDHRQGAPDVTDGTGTDGQLARREILFNDMLMLFVYEEPFDGYDAERDFDKVGMPSAALFVRDIKLLQRQAELLTEYDSDWGRDTIS